MGPGKGPAEARGPGGHRHAHKEPVPRSTQRKIRLDVDGSVRPMMGTGYPRNLHITLLYVRNTRVSTTLVHGIPPTPRGGPLRAQCSGKTPIDRVMNGLTLAHSRRDGTDTALSSGMQGPSGMRRPSRIDPASMLPEWSFDTIVSSAATGWRRA